VEKCVTVLVKEHLNITTKEYMKQTSSKKCFFQFCCIPFDGGNVFCSTGATVAFGTSGSGFFTKPGS